MRRHRAERGVSSRCRLHADRDRRGDRRALAAPRDDRGPRDRDARAAAAGSDAAAARGRRDGDRPIRVPEQAASMSRGWTASRERRQGREQRPGTTRTDVCQIGGAANTQTHGVVPWQSLGLAEQDVTDGWGNRLTYRVAPELVLDNAMNLTACDPGGLARVAAIRQASATPPVQHGTFPGRLHASIDVHTRQGPQGSKSRFRNASSWIPALAPVSTGAAYVVISHGENGQGAYSNQGILQAGTIASGTLESANNAANVAFVNSSSSTAAAFVDDFPVYARRRGALRRLAAAPLDTRRSRRRRSSAREPTSGSEHPRQAIPERPCCRRVIDRADPRRRRPAPRPQLLRARSDPGPAGGHGREPEASFRGPRPVRLAEPATALSCRRHLRYRDEETRRVTRQVQLADGVVPWAALAFVARMPWTVGVARSPTGCTPDLTGLTQSGGASMTELQQLP